MKTLPIFLSVLTLSICSFAYASKKIEGQSDSQVPVGLIDGHTVIPHTGALTGNVVTVYAGSAFGLSTYYVTVGNTAALVECEDCVVQKTFELQKFRGVPIGVYSRKIDQNTYSIAVIGKKLVDGSEQNVTPVFKKVKVVLHVKFKGDGIMSEAEMTEMTL